MTETVDLERLYRESIVIDACAPVLMQDMRSWRRFLDGGVTAVFATVTTTDDLPATIERLSGFYRLVRAHPDELVLAETTADLHRAKAEGKLAIALQFQNGRPLARDTGMIELYRRLGVGVVQLTYNYRNNIGDGCLEPGDAGLSVFGRQVVSELNRHRVLIDLSHTGERTTLEAMELSERPDVFTHANARAVFDHPRNITDRQIRAVAAKGGVVGVCAFPGFITDARPEPTVDDLLIHLDHMVDLAGIDHVGLGIDFFHDDGYWPNIETGAWSVTDWPVPPWHYPLDGGNTIEVLEGLVRRGFTDEDARKVLGGNFLRVLSDVWG